MKQSRLLIVSALAALTLTLAPGCKTTSQVTPPLATGGAPVTNQVTTFMGTVVTPAGIYSQFRGGTAQAALIALRADQNTLPYLQAVQQVLQATITTGTYDPTTLGNAIAALPLKQIHNPAALEAIESGFAMFQIIAPMLQNQVNGQNPFVIPALQGISDGIGDALALLQQSQAASTPPASPVPILNTAKPVAAPAAPSTNAPPTADAK